MEHLLSRQRSSTDKEDENPFDVGSLRAVLEELVNGMSPGSIHLHLLHQTEACRTDF